MDPLDLDDPTLSNYCHETICRGSGKRAEVLNAFEKELSAARSTQGMAFEVGSFRNLAPEFVEHVDLRQYQVDRSWETIAQSSEVCLLRIWRPQEPH